MGKSEVVGSEMVGDDSEMVARWWRDSGRRGEELG